MGNTANRPEHAASSSTGMTARPDCEQPRQALRQRARETVRREPILSPGVLEAMSPKEISWLHDLRVHQIELEVQNEELRQTQEKLDAARERYFDLYDLAPVGYCALSEQGLILEANLNAATLLGVARDALAGQLITRFVVKQDQDVFYLHQKQLFETGEPQACDLRMARQDGVPCWTHIQAVAAPGPSGAAVCRLVLSDITERKFLDDEREWTARLTSLVATSGDFRKRLQAVTDSLRTWTLCEAVGVRLRDGDDYPYYETRGFPQAFVEEERHLCARDHDGNITRDHRGNPILECMCGDVLCGRFNPAAPYFTAHGSFWSNNTTALLSSTIEDDRPTFIRDRCNREGYKSVALIPLRADQQVIGLLQFNDHSPNRFTPGLIAHFERMSDSLALALSRSQAADALRKSEQRLSDITSSIGDRVWEVDEHGVYTYISQERLKRFGPASAELLGKPPFAFMPPDEAPRVAAILAELRASKAPIRDLENWNVGKNGERICLLTNGVPILDEAGNLKGYRGVDRDITERKQAEGRQAKLERELQQAQKMESVGRLAGGVAHDFNNMLGVILGHAELALGLADPTQPIHADLEEIRKAATRSADLTRQLLAFARRQTIAPKVLDLNETVEGMIRMLRRLIGEDIDLAWRPGASLWPVRLDPSQIDQILANLCVNARYAISGVGKITIETGNSTFDEEYCPAHGESIPGDYVMVAVSDNGCGMGKETLSHLFEPFFTTKGIGEGTGLGLATVHGIVRQNGGFLNVYSEPKLGTTFKIYLPRDLSNGLLAVTDGPSKPTPRGHETILMVEDEPAILALAKRMLEQQGYVVLAARTPGEARSLALEHPGEIDLLMTDVVMPEMNGRVLAKNLLSQFPRLKRLFMSGYTADVIAHNGVLDEGVHFIQKPFSTQDLAAKVRDALDTSG